MVTVNATTTEPMKVSLFLLTFFFKHIYLLLLVIVGCIGNILVIIIFGRRALRTSVGSFGSQMSVYPFLFYMAVSDTFYLLILFCVWLTNYVNVLHRPVICQGTLYLSYVCNFINAYYTVAFTAQRLFAVVKPFRVSLVLSWRRSRSIALMIIVVACLIYSYLPFLIGIVHGRCYSLEKYRRINEIMDVIDCVLVFLIPYVMILSMNSIIVLSLRRQHHNRDEFLFQNNLQLNKMRVMTRRRASRKMTQLLLTVSTAYLIICGPYACAHTWRLLSPWKDHQKLQKVEFYLHSIYQISFAMNFYIYIVFGSKFRREFKRLMWKSRVTCFDFFREKHFDDEDFERRNASFKFQPVFILERNSNCPSMTSAGCTWSHRWKQSKLLYI